MRVKKRDCNWGIISCTLWKPQSEVLIAELQVDERPRDRILLLHGLGELVTMVTATRGMGFLLLVLGVIWQALD